MVHIRLSLPVAFSSLRPSRSPDSLRGCLASSSSSHSSSGPLLCSPSWLNLPTNSRAQSAQFIRSRIYSRTISYVAMSSSTNNSADPVERTTSPYPDPRQLGPKSKILATRTSNYHSTSLRNMVTANTVNKTALHPGGVQ